MAMIIRSVANNEGKIVCCVSFRGNITEGVIFTGPRWNIDPPLPSLAGTMINHIADANLRPIRYGDGEDEMIRMAGKPPATMNSGTYDPCDLRDIKWLK
jgi:hypothetical protein